MTGSADSSTAAPSRQGLAIIFVTVFIDLLGFGIVLPLLPRYGEAFHASGLTLGLLMSSFSAMQFVFAPLWGRLSDRIGRRPVLIVGLAGSMVFYGVFGVASSIGPGQTMLGLSGLTWLFMTRIGAGIAGATISTAQAYIADITGTKERAKGMALIGAAFGMGFTFGPLLGAGFVFNAGPEETPAMPGFVASGLSGLAMLWAIVRLPESLQQGHAASAAHRHGWGQLSRLGTALANPIIGATLIASFLTILAFAQFESTLSLLTEHLGLGLRNNFLIFAYIGLILSLVQGGVVRRLAPKLGEIRMAQIGVVTLATGMLLIGMTGQWKSLPLLMAVLPLAVIGFSFANPSFQSLLSLNASADEQGGILGLGQSVAALARIAGPVIGLSLKPYGVSTPYWCGAGIMLLAGLMTLSLKSKLAQRE